MLIKINKSFELDLHRTWVFIKVCGREWYVERVPGRGLIFDRE